MSFISNFEGNLWTWMYVGFNQLEMFLCITITIVVNDWIPLEHSISTKLYLPRDVTIYKDSFIKCHYFPRLYDKLHQLVLPKSEITVWIEMENNGKYLSFSLCHQQQNSTQNTIRKPILKFLSSRITLVALLSWEIYCLIRNVENKS